jgi:hypothetical protein
MSITTEVKRRVLIEGAILDIKRILSNLEQELDHIEEDEPTATFNKCTHCGHSEKDHQARQNLDEVPWWKYICTVCSCDDFIDKRYEPCQ